MKLFGSKDIKPFIKSLLTSKRFELENKTVLDIPAGSGYSSEVLRNLNTFVESYDLFPDFFKVDRMQCKEIDLSKELPIQNGYADFILCQEGIEHLSDQFLLFKEFNRVLKLNGTLLLTTPNGSMLRSRLSYLLTESEHFYKIMPPNEIDSIWFSQNAGKGAIYFGHVFLLGIQRLRLLAKLAGFDIKKIHHLRVNHTSLLILIFTYPIIVIVNILAYLRAMKINKQVEYSKRRKVFLENLKLGIDPRILLDGHLVVEFQKTCETDEAHNNFHNKYENFSIIT